jgi:multidrug efflux system membrane fusion protein
VGQFEGSIKGDQGLIDSAKLQLVYSRVTAPISGRIGLRLVDIGNIVHASDTNGLLVITQLQPIAVIFALPQDQLPQVATKLQKKEQLVVDAYDRDDTSKIESGKLLTIDNQIDTTTGTEKLKAVFDNRDRSMFPNQFVNIHLVLEDRPRALVVPSSAIQSGLQGAFVWVVDSTGANGAGTARLQPVKVALVEGQNTIVDSGIAAGQAVVVDGADRLRNGQAVTVTVAPAAKKALP